MLESDIRVAFGDVQCRVQVAEALRENQLRALLDHVLHHPLGVGAFGHVLCLNDLEAGDVRLHLQQPVMHRLVVAVVVDGSDV